MIIESRDKELIYNQTIKHEKIRMVIDWLLEFRFSTFAVLSKRLDQKITTSGGFFRLMVKSGLLTVFSNVHTRNQTYVILTSAAVSYAEADGKDISRAVTRVHNLGRYSTIVHDISVQEVIVSNLSNYDEVVWDRNIYLSEHHERPDALLRSKKNYWVAVEYERWRKERRRIYHSFANHFGAIRSSRYSGVYFLFDKEVDMEYYKTLFSSTEWPTFKRKPKTSILIPLAATISPDNFDKMRQCFIFKMRENF